MAENGNISVGIAKPGLFLCDYIRQQNEIAFGPEMAEILNSAPAFMGFPIVISDDADTPVIVEPDPK